MPETEEDGTHPSQGRVGNTAESTADARRPSVGSREDHTPRGGVAANHTLARLVLPTAGDAANRRLGFVLDALLAAVGLTPMRPKEAALVQHGAELSVVVDFVAVLFAERQGFFKESFLNGGQQ